MAEVRTSHGCPLTSTYHQSAISSSANAVGIIGADQHQADSGFSRFVVTRLFGFFYQWTNIFSMAFWPRMAGVGGIPAYHHHLVIISSYCHIIISSLSRHIIMSPYYGSHSWLRDVPSHGAASNNVTPWIYSIHHSCHCDGHQMMTIFPAFYLFSFLYHQAFILLTPFTPPPPNVVTVTYPSRCPYIQPPHTQQTL